MSRNDYELSKHISAAFGDPSFASLIMSAIRKADTWNLEKIKQTWPEIYAEFWARYNAPGGVLEGEQER